MKKYLPLLLSVYAIFMLGCAPTVNIEPCTVLAEEYGFFSGCWHGSIVIFSLIGSIFSDGISVYAVNNSGFGYDFGFFIFGLGGLWATIKYGLIIILSIFG